MNEALMGLASAFWLGILTSISPCPLATNIAAVSYLSKDISSLRIVVFSSIAYTIGRMIAYALLGFLIVHSLFSVPTIAQFLQQNLNRLVGPILIVSGIILLELVKVNLGGCVMSVEKQQTLGRKGKLWGSFMLGSLFALSFCPVSAALYFGSLIPLSLGNPFGSTLPIIYGLGTGLPVLGFSVCIGLGAQTVSSWFYRVRSVEPYTRKITGFVFIVVGSYYVWNYVVRAWLN